MQGADGFNDEDIERLMNTAIVIGTGPSITTEQIRLSHLGKNKCDFKLFGCNNSIFDFNLDVHHACNYQWQDEYAEKVKDYPCDKWTTRPESAKKYPWLKYIEERWIPGLSRDKEYIAAHHGTGPQLVNLAYLYGARRMLLIGWDMRHKGQRHYFGEYPPSCHHVTRNLGPDGELSGLIAEMETIKPEDYGLEIINCTPDSAMKCFPFGRLEDYICD